jgi:hypothetical protein
MLRAGMSVEAERTLTQVAARAGCDAAALGRAHDLYYADTREDPLNARPSDLLSLWPSAAAVGVLTSFDVTLAAPCSVRARAQGTTAAAIGLAEERKARIAPSLAALGVTCYHLAFSTNGRFSVKTADFVNYVARRWGPRIGLPPSVAKARLLQSISVAVHRANGRNLAALDSFGGADAEVELALT